MSKPRNSKPQPAKTAQPAAATEAPETAPAVTSQKMTTAQIIQDQQAHLDAAQKKEVEQMNETDTAAQPAEVTAPEAPAPVQPQEATSMSNPETVTAAPAAPATEPARVRVDNTAAVTGALASQYARTAYAAKTGALAEYVPDFAAATLSKVLASDKATPAQAELLAQAETAIKAAEQRRADFDKATQGIVSALNKAVATGSAADLQRVETAALAAFLAARMASGRTLDDLTRSATEGHALTLQIDAHTLTAVADGDGKRFLPGSLMSAEDVQAIHTANMSKVQGEQPDAEPSEQGERALALTRAELFGKARRLVTRAAVGEVVLTAQGPVLLTVKASLKGYDADAGRYASAARAQTVKTGNKETRKVLAAGMKAQREDVKAAKAAEAKTTDAAAPAKPTDWATLTAAAQQ